ncbi:MAG: hypothetical protein Q8Q31_03460 [Nanoarchaeota archaeon]|nr:hypothetical protein [Nanoarchaeota archaeon]
MELKELKKEYSELEKKYKLPSFDKINEDFEIEKINAESDFLLRIIRKLMMDKIVGFLNFFERVTSNPASLPKVYYQFIKAIDVEDKKEADKIYSMLGDLSLIAFEREIEVSEKGEAELIKKIYSEWNASKVSLMKLAKKMRSTESNVSKKEKSYFG